MILIRLIIYTYSYIIITSETHGISVPTEDLVDEYYTTIPKPNDNYLPQDEKDAQDIINSDRKEEVIAGILPYRDKIRRFAINQRMLTKIDPVTGVSGKEGSSHTYYWITEDYPPQRGNRGTNSTYIFMDLCFGLLEDENIVLDQYLENFFYAHDETWIIIGMVLAKDMGAMIKTYNTYHSLHNFKEQRKYQRKPFEYMLRVWVRHNREPIESAELNGDDVKRDADTLKEEYDSGSWHEKKRDQLELILMRKSIKYARAVLAKFEKAMGDKKLENIINDNVKSGCKINHDLADAYASLARYIKDKYTYIADILRKYSDGKDYWAAWVMCIAVLRPQEWPKVDQAFQKDHNDGSLSKFIMDKLTTDKVMAEMIAVIVDPKFKPTKFSGTPSTSTPPPVPPTVSVPAPPP